MLMLAAEPTTDVVVVVVGPAHVGKRALVLALGAKPGKCKGVFSWHRRQLRVFDEPQQLTPHSNGGDVGGIAAAAAVFVVVFDLTRKESFEAALAQWSFVARNDYSTGRTLLVGTKLDLPHKREVFRVDALQAAEMQFDGAYVEVNALQPPFTGVDDVDRLLRQWTRTSNYAGDPSVADSSIVTISQSPSLSYEITNSANAVRQSPLHKPKPCVRASVWLYDPTEVDDDPPSSPEHDIKLRPISRALFEIRSAANATHKAAANARDRTVTTRLQRSKYYGPTESSRHMRWHDEQKRLAAAAAATNQSRSRTASSSATREREHERLATKSFVQPTELLRQRKLEILAKKNALLAAANNVTPTGRASASNSYGTRSLLHSHPHPQVTASAQQQHKRTRKLHAKPAEARRAAKDVPAVAAARSPLTRSAADGLDFAGDPTAASTQQPQQQQDAHRWWSLPLGEPAAFSECTMHLAAPGADRSTAGSTTELTAHVPPSVPTPVASPLSERRASLMHVAFAFSTEHEAVDVRMAAAGGACIASSETTQPVDEAINATDDAAATETERADALFDITADIDNMLDYFDGVTLPI